MSSTGGRPDADTIIHHYDKVFTEHERLDGPYGSIEWIRTTDILSRVLPQPPAVVCDIGGATGRYSCWLLEHGYETHLVDLTPRHVDQAKLAMQGVAGGSRWSARVGDARKVCFSDESADAVLLMGPLYHLQAKADRLGVLGEAFRVLRSGGTLVCAAISQFASFIDGLHSEHLHNPIFRDIVTGDLTDSCHNNPTNHPMYFTTAYFQHPSELEQEMTEGGFQSVRILSVEGVLWAASDLARLQKDSDAWLSALDFMRSIEEERSLLGASPHLLGVARKSVTSLRRDKAHFRQ